MNDFFNVLDDFNLEEFALADDNTSSSSSAGSIISLDTASDSTQDVGPAVVNPSELEYNNAYLNQVKNQSDVDTLTTDDAADDGNIYVWRGNKPFSGNLNGVRFGVTLGDVQYGGENKDVPYYDVDLNNINGISFEERKTAANALTFQRSNGRGVTMYGSAGVSLALSEGGYLVAGSFDTGSGDFYFSAYDASSTAQPYNDKEIAVHAEGFASAVTFVPTEPTTTLQSISTPQTPGGVVTVENYYKFTVDDHDVNIKNVTGGALKFGYSFDNEIILDLSALTVANANDVITVPANGIGDADQLIPPTSVNEIKIGKSTYNYTNTAGNEDSYFILDDSGSATGFVLAEKDDSITVRKNQTLAVYDATDTEKAIVDVSGSEYKVTKNKIDYTLTITKSATVQIGDTKFDFSIKTPLTENTGIQITFEEDGTITNVANLANLVSTSDKVAVDGVAGDELTVGNGRTIAVASGDFTIVGGVVQTLVVAPGDTVNSVSGNFEVVTSTETGTIIDGANDESYAYAGKGYFEADATNNITGFVFQNAGDYINLPTDSAIALKYVDSKGVVQTVTNWPTVTDSDNLYTLTMTSTGEFTVSNLLAGAKVDGVTFNSAGGEAYLSTSTDNKATTVGLVGVNSTDVAFDNANILRNGGFKIGNTTLPAVVGNNPKYDATTNQLITTAAVYALGTANTVKSAVNGTEYSYSGETDGLVVFWLNGQGDVNAVTELDTGGSVSGDFRAVTVNGKIINTTDPLLTIVGDNLDLGGTTITAVDGLDGANTLTLGQVDSGLIINGNTLVYTLANNTNGTRAVVATGDGSNLTRVVGFADGDTVFSSNENTVFGFETFGTSTATNPDIFTVNNKVYSVIGDTDGISISAGGQVTGLDIGAELQVTEGPVTVNGATYTAEDIVTANLTNEKIIGFETKVGDTGSYITDFAHPLITANTTFDNLRNMFGLAFNADQTFLESLGDDFDRSADTTSAQVIFDAAGVYTSKFNDLGNNLAIVTAAASGTKNIILGNHGDAVIMAGTDEYGVVNITGGEGNDTIVVGGRSADDVVLREGSMKTVIDLSKGGVDKVHTYAAANANIVLENYDETSYSGVVLHDPEIPYIKDLQKAIEDHLLVFEDGGITAIDRDEARYGIDRKTRIKVNNANSNHQTMIRLFGYKDNIDTYSDDYGQLVGFTGSTGGVLDASDLTEDLILIGNKDGEKSAGSSLKTGIGNDTVFAGAHDTIDTGDGVDVIIMDKDTSREGATIVVGRGAGDAVMNLQSGFEGDVFDVTSYDGKLDYTFEEGVLAIIDKSSKSSLVATTTVTGDFVEQTFINGADTLYAAVAKEDGIISVTDENEIVPNYYLAKDGAIDFSAYSGRVGLDVDGLDGDWTGNNYVGTSNVTLGSAVSSLIGGKGDTIFKGGAANEVLVAGTGESSLYGGGGKNLLVGNVTEDKFGSTEFFNIGIHNGAQNTITGFEFIENGGSNQATFDALNLGLGDNNDVTDIKANADGSVTVAIKGVESGATETAVIEGAAGKEFLIDRGTQTETVAQIAATEVTVNNSYVDFYCATDDSNGATVKVGNIASTEIWLDAPDYGNGVDYSNSRFTVVDARGSNAEVLIAGNDIANTIYGGAGNASMWGGSGMVNDVMYGGTGHNEFYFEAANGNDTIMSANEGDVIHLGVSLDQINFDGTNITATGIEVKLNDGSSLTINSTSNVTFSLDDGTTATANRQTQQFE